jgi:coenzyme Q-binding protein COQ10
MPAFTTTRRVPFSAAQMYALVADVERYPEFLPMCTGLKVMSRVAVSEGEDLVARMSVGYKSIAEAFTTRVHLRPATLQVDATYIDGPFRRLENSWRLIDLPGGCDVNFHISYEFKSPMLGLLAGAAFDQAFRKFAGAFEMRARKIYGEPVSGSG